MIMIISLVCQASSETDRARLLAASSTHSGDWLHAAPIVSIGQRLLDEAKRIAVALRPGCLACESHVCVCGKTVDTRGLHGLALACRRSARRQQHNSQMN